MIRQSKGFTLIELLVAVLIIAVGILGVAGMQVVSMQQNRNALLRDQALQAGNDILDRMRANSLTTYATVALDAEPATASDCNNVLCSRLVMKDFDIAQWKCRINPMTAAGVVHDTCDTLGIQTASLPGGRGSIGVDAADANIIIVTVEWVTDRNGNTSSIALRTRTGAS